MSTTLLNVIPLSDTPLNVIPLSAASLKKDERIIYKNNVILLSKVWRKYKKHYSKVSKAINGGTIILSKCAVCSHKKSKFIKKQEGKGLLSNLGIKTLSKIPILKDILF